MSFLGASMANPRTIGSQIDQQLVRGSISPQTFSSPFYAAQNSDSREAVLI
jgi:hypothetical protein